MYLRYADTLAKETKTFSDQYIETSAFGMSHTNYKREIKNERLLFISTDTFPILIPIEFPQVLKDNLNTKHTLIW